MFARKQFVFFIFFSNEISNQSIPISFPLSCPISCEYLETNLARFETIFDFIAIFPFLRHFSLHRHFSFLRHPRKIHRKWQMLNDNQKYRSYFNYVENVLESKWNVTLALAYWTHHTILVQCCVLCVCWRKAFNRFATLHAVDALRYICC